MRTSYEAIAVAIEMYYDGFSLSKVQKYLNKLLKVTVGRNTILHWFEKYGPMVKEFTDSLKADLSPWWYADETMVRVKHKSGKKYIWYWDVIDGRTRFLVSELASKARLMSDAKALMRLGKHVAMTHPQEITTDHLPSYPKAIVGVFGRKVETRVKHTQSPGLTSEKHNLMIERFHNTLKERTKVMRGMQNLETATPLLQGFRTHYNFIRKHTAIGKTPAEAAGIRLPFENGWGDLIQWATVYQSKAYSKDFNSA